MPLAALLCVALLATAMALAAAPAEAQDDNPTAAESQLASLLETTLTPFVDEQTEAGAFPDYLHGNRAGRARGYDETVLGYALLAEGVAQGDDDYVRSGFDAISWELERWKRSGRIEKPNVFETAFMAAAYNLARRKLSTHPVWMERQADWRAWLRSRRSVLLHREPRFFNQPLVEVVAVGELLRTGVRSRKGGILARRAHYRGLADRFLRVQLRRADRDNRRGNANLLSDPPHNPLAYHALSAAFLARALEQRPRDRRSRAVLLRMVEGLRRATGPDGDIAYVGRSGEQSWALSFAAYAALRGAKLTSSPRRRAAYHELAARYLQRLRTEHVGAKRLLITPSLDGFVEGEINRELIKGLDLHAGDSTYAGLTAMGLQWARESLPATLPAPAPPARSAHRLGNGSSELAVVGGERHWLAVRPARSLRTTEDLRYPFGLVRAKAFDGERWRDLLPAFPRLTPRRSDERETGPVLVTKSGRATPRGLRSRASASGVVTVNGGFRLKGRWARRSVRFRYSRRSDGVRIEVRARPGDLLEWSTFAPHDDDVAVGTGSVETSLASIAVYPAMEEATTEPGRASAVEGRMQRIRIRARASKSGRAVWDLSLPRGTLTEAAR
ncbi:MAG: hypothetical protein ACR2NA_13755 [Solirubrobacterales bacterium]